MISSKRDNLFLVHVTVFYCLTYKTNNKQIPKLYQGQVDYYLTFVLS